MRFSIPILLIALATAGEFAVALDELPSEESRIVWTVDKRVQKAERVVTSPHHITRAWVFTPAGIQETFDAGATWTLIPNTSREELGRVTDVQFMPWDDQMMVVASRDKGVFRTDDGGKTWRNCGSRGNGLTDVNVERLAINPNDQNGNCLYAAHGNAAAGISKTIDGGKTWTTIAEKFFVHELLIDGREIIAAVHAKDDEDVWSIRNSGDNGANWREVLRDVRVTVGAINRKKAANFWFGIQKGRLLFRPPVTHGNSLGEWKQLGPDQPGDWASIFILPGEKFEDELTFAYDPHRHGLLCSRDGFATWWPENNGLFVDRLVKEGASVCASTNGRIFYASINGQLYVGRIIAEDPKRQLGPRVDSIWTTPGVLQWSPGSKITITARVSPRDAEAKSKIKAIQARLGAIKGPSNLVLLDDGKSDDGVAGDGVYAATFTPKEPFFGYVNPNRRYGFPGQNWMQIFATDVAGRYVLENFPLTAYQKPASFVFWNGEDTKNGMRMADGRRGNGISFDERNGNIVVKTGNAHSGENALNVLSKRAPWIVGWTIYPQSVNLSNHESLVFWIKGDKESNKDVKVLLADMPIGENDANHSDDVWLIRDGYIKQITTEYQFVRIPLTRFNRQTEFMIEAVCGVVFAGSDPAGDDFLVDDIGFEVPGQPLK
jgi:hypothetical protein